MSGRRREPHVAALPSEIVREALRALGESDPPAQRGAAQRELRAQLAAPGAVRDLLEQAPPQGRELFTRLVHEGPATVEELLGRGWWQRGALPTPLDWLERRALVTVAVDGRVHPVREAAAAFVAPTLDLHVPAAAGAPEPPVAGRLRVQPAGCVLVAETPGALDEALAVTAAGLEAVATTVAVSALSAEQVRAALQAAGIRLDDEQVVAAAAGAPALPDTAEEAVGPRALRELLARAVAEGRQLRLQYYASSRGGAPTQRTVDPWAFADDLLRGYCHLRDGERSFAVDRIGRAWLLPTPRSTAPS